MKALKLNPTLTQRNPHNVERSGFHRGEHVAYGTNREGAHDVWRVRKIGNRYEATARATGERLSGRTLKEVGAAIEAQSPRFEDGKVPHRNPPLRDNVYLATVRMARGKHRYFGAFAEFDEVIKQPGAGHVVTYVLNVAGDRLILQNVTPEGIYHFRSEDGATFTGEKVSAEEVKAKIADAVSLESPEDYYHDQNLPRKSPHRNPPKPGTYAGGVGFWRKSIGLSEGAPKHLVPRPKHTTDVDYVEYVRPLAGEPVFELGGNRYQYVVGRYPSGREDIAVYSYAGDVTHGYAFFRRMLNLP